MTFIHFQNDSISIRNRLQEKVAEMENFAGHLEEIFLTVEVKTICFGVTAHCVFILIYFLMLCNEGILFFILFFFTFKDHKKVVKISF